MTQHNVMVCRTHDTVVQRCRCPGPHTSIKVDCPGAGICTAIIDRDRAEAEVAAMPSHVHGDERANATIAAGAVMAALWHIPGCVQVMPDPGDYTSLIVEFEFMKSPYKLTVRRIEEDV
jgi:hypothetical protein